MDSDGEGDENLEEEVEEEEKESGDERGMRYVDDIAEDEDDPEAADEEEEEEEEEPEEEEDDDELDTEAKRRKLFQSESTFHAAIDQEREKEELERLEKETAEKYGSNDQDPYDAERQLEEEEGVGSGQNRLPSVRDPKLWLVRCDPGKEEVAVLALIQKAFRKEGTSEQLFIKSAFITPAAKGYVYVEADKEIHVKRAIQGIRILKWWKILLVPIKEMVDAISIKQVKAVAKKKQWVRIRGGLFKGDLAQVVALEDQGERVTIKCIPRIDIGLVEAENKKGGAKRKKSSVRPLAKLFNKQDIIDAGGIVTHKNGSGNDPHSSYDFFKNQKFKHGFLYRTVQSRSLQLDCAPPSLDEVEQFQARLNYESESDEEEDGTLGSSIPEVKRTASFIKDDRVIVTSGDLKNLTGRVLKVYNNLVTMMPDRSELTEALEFPTEEVRKYFRVGDHVKVISGKYKDETGLIVQVTEKDDTVIVFSDISSKEMRLYSQDIIESAEVSTGRDALGDYQLYDLVQLDRDVAVIVKVEVGTFKVMLGSGVVKTIKLQDIDKKRASRFATALDSGSNQIVKDDVVKVMSGPHRGKQGSIKHIHRSCIYLHSRQVLENSGIFVAQSKHCMLMGQTMSKPMTPSSPSVGGGGRDRAGRDRGGGQQRTPDYRRDPMIDVPVFITQGPWKGYVGRVIAATELLYRVSLHALCKTVSVNRNQVTEKNDAARKGDHASSFPQTPLIGGSQTPSHWQGGATPARGDGGMTPARTPSRDPHMTPSRDVWNPMTPRHNPKTPRTPRSPGNEQDYDLDFDDDNVYNQPWASGSTATPNNPITPHTPHTPHTPITPHTPHEPHTPKTPGMGLDDTPHDLDTPNDHHDDIRTPNTPGNPFTPHTPTTPNTSTPGGEYSPRTPSTPYDEHSAPATPNDASDDEGGYAGGARAHTGQFMPGVLVRIVPDGQEADDDEDDEEGPKLVGTILSQGQDGSFSVKMDSGEVRNVSMGQIKAVVPDKNDEVKIVSGDHKGDVGTLIGIDAEDGIVKIAQDIIILPLATLVKFRSV